MPLTAIDSRPALVVIDLQKGLATRATVHPFGDIVARSARLATAFRSHGFPVVLVNATGTAPGRTEAAFSRPAGFELPPEWAEIVDEMDAQPGDHRITKQRAGAFYATDLDDYLQGLGVTQVVLTGVATGMGVESTARAAHERGYNVVLVTDAMTDVDAAVHENSVKRIFPRLGETATTDEVLAMLPTAR
jgi:nicotinamidase-related amidase